MLMWSPLYVAHPRANSERSPVPITNPPCLFAKSINNCVRSRACVFSYVTSCTSGSCPKSAKCCIQASLMLISTNVAPSFFIISTALVYVRLVVPKPGIVTPIIFERSMPNLSHVFAQTSKARVESNPPLMPNTIVFNPVWCKRVANPDICILNISSQFSSILSYEGTNGAGENLRDNSASTIGQSTSMYLACSVLFRGEIPCLNVLFF